MAQSVAKGIDWSCTGIESSESILERFWTSKKWDYARIISLILSTIAIVLPVFIVYRGVFATVNIRVERSLVISLLLVFAFLKYPLGKRRWSDRPDWLFAVDLLLVLLTIGAEAYTLYGEGVRQTVQIQVSLFGNLVRTDFIVGWIYVILVLEATRRAFGWIIVSVPIIFLIYALTANWWPGPLFGAKASWTYLAGMLYVETMALFGTGIDVLLSMIFVFLLFGSFMVSTKVGAFFMSLANALVGRYVGGPAKAAVVASAFFGSVSGSAVANVATTGCVTIPMMKSMGYKPEFAGAVEACASSGGSFTPPVMSASAFLIASFARIPYLLVALYAALPAILYYLAIFLQVHIRAKKTGLAGLPIGTLPSPRKVAAEGWYLLLPLVFIVVGLVMGYGVTLVAIWGMAGVILVSFFSSHTRQNPRQLVLMVERATLDTIGISLAVVIVGVLEGAATVSGLGSRLSALVEVLAGGHLLVGLLIAAIVLIILGMGISPLLVYYMGYIFILPALVKLGAPAIPGHLFLFIYGSVASFTPPVALAAFTAASIAQASPMKTGFEAMKLGFAAYLVPFLIVYQPSLLFLGNPSVLEAAVGLFTATLGIVCLAIAFEGWLFRRAAIWERLLVLLAGLLQVLPSIGLSLAGLGLAALTFFWLWYSGTRTKAQEGIA